MSKEQWKSLDNLLRLRLSELPPDRFERFFLQFLRANVSLTINRDGRAVTKRVIAAEMYAPGSGRNQRGIDLRLEVEGREVWVFQCKRVRKWTLGETQEAIEKATQYPANHYFLAVACDTNHAVHDEMAKHPQWTLWNLDTICAEFRSLVAPAVRREILSFLSPEEVRRFMPFTTEALITPESFFARFMGEDKPLRHDWPIVGREEELEEMRSWAKGSQKVLLLNARGGEGKTRLLREFCADMEREAPDTEVLFLNPHGEIEDMGFSLGLSAQAAQRVIIVDDAHRTELVPLPLLAYVRQDPKAKIILASRPQGEGSISKKLTETGFGLASWQFLHLSPLKKPAVRRLAKEILGETLKDHVETFLTLTEGNPFLITTAGGLIRQEILKWGSWNSDQDFRRRVFHEFEQENLATIPESERTQAGRLLRVLAILSPVVIGRDFVERATSLMGGALSVEQLLNFLRQIELVVGSDKGVRVAPDLFADFLVYETCFDPKKREPIWATQVMESFSDQGAGLIRNISEASWIAQINGVKDEKLLEPLMKKQRERFLSESFVVRAATVQYWSTFSLYLPKESLELADLAIQEKTAPPESSRLANLSDFDSQTHVLKQIPGLLAPVAKYHDAYRQRALDILWRLGCAQTKVNRDNRNHPWTVIAEAFKIEKYKPVESILLALDWLEALVRKPETLDELARPEPVLRLFLEPCFSRKVDACWQDGITFHLSELNVALVPTQPIRDRALKILAWLIENGSGLVVLDALAALEVAIQRVGLSSVRGVKGLLPKAISTWHPERLKALALYQQALAKHTDVVVRYEIWKTLKRDLACEEDSGFAEECRQILAAIPQDLSLRVAVALSTDYIYAFENTSETRNDPDWISKSRQRFDEHVDMVARELHTEYPSAKALYDFLDSFVGELIRAGYSPSSYPLLFSLGKQEPHLALEIAALIISADADSPLAPWWPALIHNEGVADSDKNDLFEKVVRLTNPGPRIALIQHLSFALRQDRLLDDSKRALLFEIGRNPTEKEAFYLLELIQNCGEINLPWAFELLDSLAVETISPQLLGAYLTALVPYQERKTNPPQELVRHVFQRFLVVPDLDFFQHALAWDKLKKLYPLEMYHFLHERIFLASAQEDLAYTPAPHGLEDRLRLPELAQEPTISSICEELWNRVTSSQGNDFGRWLWLFQAVVLEETGWWHDRLLSEIGKASDGRALFRLVRLINFEGSLIIFAFPDISQAFLLRAKELGGRKLLDEIKSNLYCGAGPRIRGYTNGQLDQEYDYLEAEALKAAERHALNEVLGPFYRWIAETEQNHRIATKVRAEAEMSEY